MNKVQHALVVLLTGVTIYHCAAQQDTQFSQYMLNPLLFNPAYAGSREVISITTLHRAQWLGIDGAPSTQNIAIHAPVLRGLGAGIIINNDAIGNGTVQSTDFKGAVSYTIPLDRDLNTKLSFGLNFGGSLNQVNFNNLVISNNQTNDQGSGFFPNFGVGIFLRNPSYYFGLSNSDILENSITTDNNNDILYRKIITWHLIGGYIFRPVTDWQIKPAILTKINSGAPFQLDVSLTALFKEKFEFGPSYRFGSGVSLLLGYHFADNFYGGMAYDNEITDLGGQSFLGKSFEFFLRYEFKDRKCKCSPKPRFY